MGGPAEGSSSMPGWLRRVDIVGVAGPENIDAAAFAKAVEAVGAAAMRRKPRAAKWAVLQEPGWTVVAISILVIASQRIDGAAGLASPPTCTTARSAGRHACCGAVTRAAPSMPLGLPPRRPASPSQLSRVASTQAARRHRRSACGVHGRGSVGRSRGPRSASPLPVIVCGASSSVVTRSRVAIGQVRAEGLGRTQARRTAICPCLLGKDQVSPRCSWPVTKTVT